MKYKLNSSLSCSFLTLLIPFSTSVELSSFTCCIRVALIKHTCIYSLMNLVKVSKMSVAFLKNRLSWKRGKSQSCELQRSVYGLLNTPILIIFSWAQVTYSIYAFSGYLLIPSVHDVKLAGGVFGLTDQLLLPLFSSIPVSYKRLPLQEPGHLHSRLALSSPLQSLLQRRTVCHEAVHPDALPGPGCDSGLWVSVGHLHLQLNPLKVLGKIICLIFLLQ